MPTPILKEERKLSKVQELIEKWKNHATKERTEIEESYCGDAKAFVRATKVGDLELRIIQLELAYQQDLNAQQGQ